MTASIRVGEGFGRLVAIFAASVLIKVIIQISARDDLVFPLPLIAVQ
tara:strand:- start:233 stop:373 length:141 start_codon:yes stop_codon:yes gene_type:complete